MTTSLPIQAMAFAAGAGVAAHLLERPADRGEQEPVTRQPGYADGVTRLRGASVVCGVRRLKLAELTPPATVDARTMLSEFRIHRESLVAHYGAHPDGRTPRAPATCLQAWIRLWVDAWDRASSKNAINFRLVANGYPTLDVHGFDRQVLGLEDGSDFVQAWARKWGLTDLGKAMSRLRELDTRLVFLAGLGDTPADPGVASSVREAIGAAARALDTVGQRAELDVDLGELVVDEVKDLPENIGGFVGGLGAGVVGVAASALKGLVFSDLFPILLVGGAVVFIVYSRRPRVRASGKVETT